MKMIVTIRHRSQGESDSHASWAVDPWQVDSTLEGIANVIAQGGLYILDQGEGRKYCVPGRHIFLVEVTDA